MATLPDFIFMCGVVSLIQAVRYAYRNEWRVGLRFCLVLMTIVAVMAATFAPRFARMVPTNTRMGSAERSELATVMAVISNCSAETQKSENIERRHFCTNLSIA
jgi:hypothetical protein